MKSIRSRGFDMEKPVTVTVQIQLSEDRFQALDEHKVLRMIRKIRRRYGNTGGVEYMVEVNLPDQ